MKRNFRLLSATLVIALAPIANAQTAGEVDTQVNTLDTTAAQRGQPQVAERIADDFASLAGGHSNALALVEALRNGTPVTLTPRQHATMPGTGATGTGMGTTGTGTTGTGTGATGTGTTGTGTGTTGAGTGTTGTGTGTTGTGTTATGTTITPPTGHMGWGSVYISLALAKAVLANDGIRHPTPDQLQAALTGGTVTKADGTTVTAKGVLELRAQGMGWGQVAHAEGTKLGPVLASLHSEHHRLASLPHDHDHMAGAGGTHHGDDDGDHGKHGAGMRGDDGTRADDHGHGKGLVAATGSTTPPSGKGHEKGLVTANGSSVTSSSGKGHDKGIVTANGAGTSASSGKGHDKGIVTANGASASVIGKGHDKGIVTAGAGAPTSVGHGSKGITTAAGGGAGGTGITTAASHGGGAGVVTAAGTTAAGAGGIVTAAGGDGANSGEGKGHGRGHGGG